MSNVPFEIVPATWPDKVSTSKKALLDFLESDLAVAEIKGDKDFLNNVRRAARSDLEIWNKVDLTMKDNRLFIRRKNGNSPA